MTIESYKKIDTGIPNFPFENFKQLGGFKINVSDFSLTSMQPKRNHPITRELKENQKIETRFV